MTVGKPFSEFQVEWEYDLTIPDYIGLYNVESGAPKLLKSMSTNNGRVVSAIVSLPSGYSGTVAICSINVPDFGKQFEFTERYCYFSEVDVHEPDMQPLGEDACDIPPSILSVDPFRGGLLVKWNNLSNYDFFDLEITTRGGQTSIIEGIKSQSYQVQGVKEAGTYTFRVKGFKEPWSPFFSGCSSEYSAFLDEKMPDGLVYQDPRLSELSHLSAVAPDSTHMNVFIIGDDGIPRTSFWNESPWSMWYIMMGYNSSGQPETEFYPETPIESIAINQNRILVFAVDATQSMRVSTLRPTDIPTGVWRDISMEMVFPKNCHIGVTSRSANYVDIFAVGNDGQLYVAWLDNATKDLVFWKGWVPMGGPQFPPGAPVAALSRSPHRMNVAAVSQDGIVKLRWWNGYWDNWEDLHGARFLPGSHLSFVARSSDHIDLFGIDENGQLQNNHWNGGWSGWQVLPSPPLPLTPGASLSAVSRKLEHVEVFYMDQHKRLWSTWFYDGWNGAFQVPSNGYLPEFHPHVSAISRNNRQMDVFGINAEQNNDRVWSTWFSGGKGDWSKTFFPV
ncbi:hypothetical protein [Planococcus shenhongbingii]|uniref:hypothetical protein n=1 Tax=Planococcus shenhongbingii TaxID=3058398 RepID=UPI00265B5728|nr:hypothetical protein [Planococcus sp. N017]